MKNQYDVEIESMSHGSFGIARVDVEARKIPIFVENVCPGDSVTLSVYDNRKSFAFAELLAINKASEFRDPAPKCKLHKVCGGCQWQQIDYQKQLEYKRKNIIDLLVTEKVLDPSWREDYKKDLDLIPQAFGMDNPWNYRNKIIYPVGVKENGRVVAGYYVRNTHDLINIKHCPIQYFIFDQVIEAIKSECTKSAIKKSWLRHIALRANRDQSEILVTFIIRSKLPKYHALRKPNDDKYFNELKIKLLKISKSIKAQFDQIKGVAININDDSTNVILGNITEVLLGEPYITDELNGLKFRVSPTSFFQVNNEQAEKLTEKVIEYVAAQEGGKILDAYCGTGTLAISVANFKKLMITGIEAVESSVVDAKANAKLNNIDSVDFRLGKVEENIGDFQEGDFDTIITNPPRKGCTNKVLDAFGKISPQKIVYVSCNPATLARDIKYLEKFGYKLKKLQPIDLFPHTFHIESVCLLSKL